MAKSSQAASLSIGSGNAMTTARQPRRKKHSLPAPEVGLEASGAVELPSDAPTPTCSRPDAYAEFLASKLVRVQPTGFEADPSDLSPHLFQWQRDIVRWALRLGRAALFEDCGLGKSLQQLVWSDAVARHTGRPVLILAPLAVAPQTIREGAKFGISVNPVRSNLSVRPVVNITNYQKLLSRKGDGLADGWDLSVFGGVVLDESSILKSYMGKTKQLLCSAFKETPFRLACTATPAPNDYVELGNHAQFLGVMDSDEMLARWFINDTMQSGNYRLKGHAEADFWRWVCSWAVCVGKPSDLGYDDAGFTLPPLEMHEHVVVVDATEGADGTFWRIDKLTATTLHQEMRRTAPERSAAVAELVNNSTDAWVVWCNTDYEADALRKVLTERIEVRGSFPEHKNEKALEDFATGKARVLIAKPSQCGFGLNWQHCHKMAFVGLSYSHEQLYQAIRRSWRFGQQAPVDAHIFCAETEGEVLKTLKRKEADHQRMQQQMGAAMRQGSLDELHQRRELSVNERRMASGDAWTLHNGDCVEVVRELPADSIDFTVFSPPFSSLYIYSDALQDMGNSASDEEFFVHFLFLAKELYRVTVTGRLCAIHCKDLPLYKGRDDAAGLKDFPGWIVRVMEQVGWTYHSNVTIWKDPVIERARTNNNGLLHKTLCRDSSQVRQGMCDFLKVFRKFPTTGKLESSKPVSRPHDKSTCFDHYVGSKEPVIASSICKAGEPEPGENYGLEVWQRYASGVWFDIDQTNVLQGHKQATAPEDEKHICPLQLDVIERAVELWTNPGDLVLSPFAGIGSEGYVSLLAGRRYTGVELKPTYWQKACKNLAIASEKARQKTLFGGAA